jgi:hypothetical protein
MLNLGPNDTKTLHVDLKPGTYKVHCPVEDHAAEGMMLSFDRENNGGGYRDKARPGVCRDALSLLSEP